MIKLIIIIFIFTFNVLSENLSDSINNIYSTDSSQLNDTTFSDSNLIINKELINQLTNNKKIINRLYDWLLSHENAIDSLKQIIDSNSNIDNTYIDAKNKYLDIENLYSLADSMKKKSYYETSPQKHNLKLKAIELHKQADTALSSWQTAYPFYSDVIKNLNKKIKKDFYQFGGIVQVATGITAMVLTIVYANRENKIMTDVPVYNSRGIQTGTESLTITYKNKWTIGHTILTTLSGGLIISGIFTFQY